MKQPQRSIPHFLRQQSEWQLGVGSVLMLGVIWGVDYLLNVDLGLSILYVLPIAAISWYVNPKLGYWLSLLSAVLWFAAETHRVTDSDMVPFLVWNAAVRLAFFGLMVTLLAQLKAAYRQEQKLANTDFLTALLNRRAFTETLEQEIQRSRRYELPFTLAYLDIDNFKQVNDRLGHAAGDRLLKDVAMVLRQQLRTTDCQARLGGDEFAMLLPQTEQQQATIVLQRVFAVLSQLHSDQVVIGFSIGAVTFASMPDDASHALSMADKVMYSAKGQGKNQFVQAGFEQIPSREPEVNKGSAEK
ncbi:MAG: GGDEF domain-containing protein [Leptolyngbyaceae cyanobacterium]